MNSKRTLIVVVALLAMLVSSGWAATLEVTQPTQLTSDSYYERGQSIVYDGSNYWLFYGRSATCTDPYSIGNPDVYDYVLYYKTAGTVAGLASAAATQVLVGGLPVTSSYMGETAATYFGGNVCVYATIHDGISNTDLYAYYTGDGGTTWTQVGPIVAGMSGGQGHHDAVVFNGEVWVLEGSGDFNTMHSATPTNPASFSTPLLVPGGLTGGLGHFLVDGSDLYLALGSAGTYYIHKYNSGTVAWDLVDSKAMAGYYDPTLFKVDGTYVFYCAPYTGGRQWIEGWWGSTLDGTFFDGAMVDVIEGRYGSNVWVDMWPIGFVDDNGDEFLLYTSERDLPTAEGAGNIWVTEVDWTITNDHYTYIKEAVDSSASGDVVTVAAGAYEEAVVLTPGHDLTLAGAGRDVVTWVAPPGGTALGASLSGYTGAMDYEIYGFTFDCRSLAATTHGTGIGITEATHGPLTLSIHDCRFVEDRASGDDTHWGTSMWVCHNRFAARDGLGNAPVHVYDNIDETWGGMVISNCQAYDIYGNLFDGCTDAIYNGHGCPDVTGQTFGDHHIYANTFKNASNLLHPGGSDDPSIAWYYYGAGGGTHLPSTIENNVFEDNDAAVIFAMDTAMTYPAHVISNNSFVNNGLALAVVGASATTLDASGNWWDSTDATTVAAVISGDVDYTPWLGSGADASGDPGFQGDYSTLYVDDDSAQSGSTGRIQEGIDLVSGSTVHVAAGTYAERVTVNKTVDLRGAQYGVDPTAAGARTTPASESVITELGLSTPNPDVLVELASGATNVSIDGFTLDGDPTNPTADTSTLRCWADGITIANNIITGRFCVLYKGGDGLTVESNRMTANKLGVTCQPGASTNVTVSDNTFYLGGTPAGDESAMYMTSCDGLTVTGNTANTFVNSKGIAGSTVTDVLVSGNDFSGNRDGVSFWGTTTFVDITGNDLSDCLRYGVNIKGQDVDITHNTITGCGDVGVNVDRHVIDTERISVNYNNISGNTNYGIYVNTALVTETVDGEMNWWGDASGPNTSKGTGDRVSAGVDYDPWIGGTGGENIVCDEDPTSLITAIPTKTVDVNYLGGGGGMMYGYTLKFTWDGAIAGTAPGSVTQGTLLSGSGSTFWDCRSTGTDEITVTCILLGDQPGVTGPGTMFSIDFTGLSFGTSPIDITIDRIRDKDNITLSGFYEDDGELIVDVDVPVIASVGITNSTLTHTDNYVKDGDTVVITADVTDDDPGFDAGNITADLGVFGLGSAVNPDSYVAPTATWTLAGVTCSPSDGLIAVTVDAADDMGNSATQGSDDITADNIAPSVIAGFDAAPAHEECVLSWTDASGNDLNYEGVAIRRYADAAAYPDYTIFVGLWPGITSQYPATQLSGDVVYDGTGTGYTDGVVDRNIYYYQAFCYDWARNYSIADAGAQDLATNYWLGDVAAGWGTWASNGLVDANDILNLSDAYGTSSPSGDFATCDIGPTVHPDWHRLGLPKPDDEVEFEDAMIFAMNYGVVTARVVPFLPEEYNGSVLALTLDESGVAGDEIEIALQLEGNTDEVKGMSAEIAYDSSELEFVSARLSDDMSSPLADVFFWSGAESDRVLVDALVLGTGTTIGGSGDVAVLTFRTIGDGYSLEVESARIRNVDNVELDAKLGDIESGGDTPLVFHLVQNAPNPFNPVTKVAYHVPRESEVTIRVYDVSGRVVRTLVDGVVEAGRHAAVWDGRNDNGEAVGSGVYFCTMEAPEFHDSRKMTLLK